MNREQRNYQFDFLRPQHSLFQYFTKLLEQYTKILIPPKDLMARLKTESSGGRESANTILEQIKYRANWQRHQEAQKKREEEKVERERGTYISNAQDLFNWIFRVNKCLFDSQLLMLKLIGTILSLLKRWIINHSRREISHRLLRQQK